VLTFRYTLNNFPKKEILRIPTIITVKHAICYYLQRKFVTSLALHQQLIHIYL